METIECSVWNNGGNGWGVKVLGGPQVRRKHFRHNLNPILVEVDGSVQEMNVDKESFWTKSCGELIHKSLRDWKGRHHLKCGNRVLLRVIEPFCRFRLEP